MEFQSNVLIVALLLVISNFKTIEGFAVDCLYETRSFDRVGSIYTCGGTVLADGSVDENLTRVYGLHETGKQHEDVQAIAIRDQNLQFAPTNVEQFFPNIIVIDLRDNNITTISNRHLLPFPNLKSLIMWQNKVTSVEGDLFKGINGMVHYSFSRNDVRHVGHELNLQANGGIYFSDNPCINQAADLPSQVASLKLNLLRNCPPSIALIERSLEQRQNLLTSLDRRVESVTNNVTEIEKELVTLRQDRNYLWDAVYVLSSRVASLESIIGGRVNDETAVPLLTGFENNKLTKQP